MFLTRKELKPKQIFLSSLLIFYLSSCSTEERTINWNDEELSWHSFDDGLKQLNASGKNGLIIIYADWCQICKQYSKLFINDSVIQALQGVTLIRANIDKEPDISDRFNIDGGYVPRTFALDKNGNIIQDLDSNNPKWSYYLPANDPEHLIRFVTSLKQY